MLLVDTDACCLWLTSTTMQQVSIFMVKGVGAIVKGCFTQLADVEPSLQVDSSKLKAAAAV